jgi:hypothetical protein
MCCNVVVFPAPKNPANKCTGILDGVDVVAAVGFSEEEEEDNEETEWTNRPRVVVVNVVTGRNDLA